MPSLTTEVCTLAQILINLIFRQKIGLDFYTSNTFKHEKNKEQPFVWLDRWHSFIWVWVCTSQRIPLSVLARNPHKGRAHEITYETGRRRGKARSQGRKQKKAVNRTGQSAEGGSPQKRTLKRREQELGPVDSEVGLANVRGWVNVTDGCVGISLEYTLAIAHSYTKVSQTSPFLRLELTQVRACLFFFSSTSRLCMLSSICL